jgi:hypothetical protein
MASHRDVGQRAGDHPSRTDRLGARHRCAGVMRGSRYSTMVLVVVVTLASCGGSDPVAAYQQRDEAACRASQQAGRELLARVRDRQFGPGGLAAAEQRAHTRFVSAIATPRGRDAWAGLPAGEEVVGAAL